MSHFVVTGSGIVLNRTAAADGRVPLAAWDIGSAQTNSFLSTQPTTSPRIATGKPTSHNFPGNWVVCLGENDNQVLVRAKGVIVGQVNRRAAAILAPLLQGDLIDVEVQQNQATDGQVGKALYIFAKLGVEGREQVVREPSTIRQARAYVALLACTMKALKSKDQSSTEVSDSDSGREDEEEEAEEVGRDFVAPSWHKLPGTLQWDCATGSIGNTVNPDLIDQLGSRTLALLRSSGASTVRKSPS